LAVRPQKLPHKSFHCKRRAAFLGLNFPGVPAGSNGDHNFLNRAQGTSRAAEAGAPAGVVSEATRQVETLRQRI
jgi:hypothetical protein